MAAVEPEKVPGVAVAVFSPPAGAPVEAAVGLSVFLGPHDLYARPMVVREYGQVGVVEVARKVRCLELPMKMGRVLGWEPVRIKALMELRVVEKMLWIPMNMGRVLW